MEFSVGVCRFLPWVAHWLVSTSLIGWYMVLVNKDKPAQPISDLEISLQLEEPKRNPTIKTYR